MKPRYNYQADDYELLHDRAFIWVCRECDQEKEMLRDHVPGECECGGTFYESASYTDTLDAE